MARLGRAFPKLTTALGREGVHENSAEVRRERRTPMKVIPFGTSEQQ